MNPNHHEIFRLIFVQFAAKTLIVTSMYYNVAISSTIPVSKCGLLINQIVQFVGELNQ